MRKKTFLIGLVLLLAITGVSSAQDLSRQERAEIRFLEGMIDHHQMALDMAEHCLAVIDGDDIHDLCQAVIDAQTPEIEQMQAWLLEWYNIAYTPMSMLAPGHEDHETSAADPVNPSPPEVMGMMGDMAGMMDRMAGMMEMMGGSGMMGGMGMMHGEMMGMMQNMSDMMTHMHNMMQMMDMADHSDGAGEVGETDGHSGHNTGADHSGHQTPTPQAETPAGAGDHSAHHPAGAPEPAAETADHSAHQDASTGPFTDMAMTMGMMAGLDRVTGRAYAIAWLESMIDHHDDAIHMAERLLPRVVHPELGELAQQIIDDQSAEIEQMEALIAVLANTG